MTAQPTLLVFTLGPRREQARRRLLPESLNAVERELHRECYESALEAGRRCGWPIAVASPQPVAAAPDVTHLEQTGATFGSRFRRAFAQALAAATGPVVAVGSDAPGLDSSHLLSAVSALAGEPDRVVIGPAADGGFYLLAASRPLDAELSGVRWRCRNTLATLRRLLADSGREVVLLAPLEDLDRPQDLTRWMARDRGVDPRWVRCISALRRALADLGAVLRDVSAALRPGFATATHGRAPPR